MSDMIMELGTMSDEITVLEEDIVCGVNMDHLIICKDGEHKNNTFQRHKKHTSTKDTSESIEMQMYKRLKERNFEEFKYIVEQEGGDVNCVFSGSFVDIPDRGWTALHFVCQKGRKEQLNMLLELGANPSLTDMKGNTPLHVVCKHGHYNLIKPILDVDNSLKDKQNLQGLTPLMKAVYRFGTAFKENDYDKTINCLLEAGCDVNLRPKSNMSLLHVAAVKWKSAELVQRLLDAGADVNADTGLASPLMSALCRQKVDPATVAALVHAGANVNYQNPSLKSVLHIAVSRSEDICVEYLLAAGADPNITDIDGNIPLWIAVCENDIKVTPLLLHYGGNVNFTNERFGMSLLSKAVYNRNKKMVKLLLEHKADVNSSTNMGENALHYAIDGGNLELVKLILRENPDLNGYRFQQNVYDENNGFQNAFQISIENRNNDIIRLLLEIGFPVPHNQMQLEWLERVIEDDEALVTEIYNYLYNPRSLHHICRVELRKYLGTDVKQVVDTLVSDSLIPVKVAEKILMKDILD